MLELAVLGLLKERSMHGYQLKKHLADTLGSFWQVSYGSLYPALRRLQRERFMGGLRQSSGVWGGLVRRWPRALEAARRRRGRRAPPTNRASPCAAAPGVRVEEVHAGGALRQHERRCRKGDESPRRLHASA